MHVSQELFSRDTLAGLSDMERDHRLRELEVLANHELKAHTTLAAFQECLYAIIAQFSAVGHFLGPWEYDCEIEYWGGKSYMDASVDDELLLRSEFPHGIRLAWREYELLHRSVP